MSRLGRWRARLGVALLLVLTLAAGTGWVALRSSALGVDSVRVSGVSRLTADEVRSAAAIPAGTPLVRLDTAAVARRLSRLTAVRGVEVRRDWPGTVIIAVRERTPVAARVVGTSFALVDAEGVAFATRDRRPNRLPLVSAPVADGPAALRAAVHALTALPPTVREDVRQVRAATVEQVSILLSRGRLVVWGSIERAQRKAAVLAVLLTRKASVYDVSAPDTPTTRR